MKCCSPDSGEVRTLGMKYTAEYAQLGLRTLVFAIKKVPKSTYYKLLSDYNHALGLVGSTRGPALAKALAKIECDMQPISVTGVEDKLQPGVKKCVQSLREAGIKVWVLTGDKAETAVSVSKAVGHFAPEMALIKITDCSSVKSAAKKIFQEIEGLQQRRSHRLSRIKQRNSSVINQLEKPHARSSVVQFFSNLKAKFTRKTQFIRYKQPKHVGIAGEPVGLVIDGKSLRYALHSSVRTSFLELSMLVTTVLCCRLTPLQKASIVQLIQAGLAKYTRRGVSPVTAAIGDGGNDVAMINQASVGIAIYGKEGHEAARASDYALTHFRHLHRLLLIHGQWDSYRINYTLLFFYNKCVAFVTTQLVLIFYKGFSEYPSYGNISFMLFNLTMTFVVNMNFGMFERHIVEDTLLSKPHLYRTIANLSILRVWYIALWTLDGIWQGLVVYFTSHFALAGGRMYSPATFFTVGTSIKYTYDFTLVGCGMYVYIWMSVIFRSLVWTRDVNEMIVGGFFFTLVNLPIIYTNQTFGPVTYLEFHNFSKLATSPTFWLGIPFAFIFANIPALVWRVISDSYWTIQLSMRKIPASKRRQCYHNNLRLWLKAMVLGDPEELEKSILEERSTRPSVVNAHTKQ